MTTTKNIDINKQIIFEKGDFLMNNSSFLHKNLLENAETLKALLLSPTPLKSCPEYNEIIDELNNSKSRNRSQLNYQYSLEILFHIVTMMRKRAIASEENIELIRTYIKYISSKFSESERVIYDSQQKIVNINKEQLDNAKTKVKR